MADIPQQPPHQPPHAPLVVHDTDKDDIVGSDDDDDDNAENDDDDRSNDDDDAESNDEEPANSATSTDADDNKSDGNQRVQRLQRKGKGVTKKYADYSLLMAARQAKKGGPRWAFICKECVFFSGDNLSNAKPIPEEDREEFVLGVALVHYLMNAGIKRFKEKG